MTCTRYAPRGRRSITYRRGGQPLPPRRIVQPDLALHDHDDDDDDAVCVGCLYKSAAEATPLNRQRVLFARVFYNNIYIYIQQYPNTTVYCTLYCCVYSIFYCVHAAAAELIKLYTRRCGRVGYALVGGASLFWGCGAKRG
uniref:Uncharacterized protein n=1 Tax=Schizaphis graminum TaxID=13262 RepID=A0A2S2PTA2_SCHGA